MIAIKYVGITLLILIALIVIILHFSATVYVHAARDGVRVSLKFMGFKLYPRKPKAQKASKKKLRGKKKDSKPDEPDADTDDDPLDEITDDMLMQGLTDEQERALLEDSELADKADEADDIGEEKWDGEPEDDDEPIEAAEKTTDKKSKKKDNSKKKQGGLKAKIEDLKRKWEKIKPYVPTSWKYFKKLCKSIRFSIDDVWVIVGREDAHEAAIYYGMINAAIADLLRKLAMAFTCKVKRCTADVKWAENCIDGSADITVRVRPSTLIAIVFCVGIKLLFIFLAQKIKNRRKKKAENSNNASPEPAL